MSKSKVKYISASQIDMFLSCPLAYKYIYVDNAKRMPANAYMEYGSAIHEALAFNFKQKIKSRKDLPIKDVRHVFTNYFVKKVQELPTYTEEWLLRTLTLQGEEMISQYMEQLAPKYQPILVEEKFEISLKTYPITIMGYIDLITEDGIIIDHKTAWTTTRQKWTQKFVDDHRQLTMYDLAFRKIYNKPPKALRIDVLKRLKGWPRFASLDSHRSDTEILALVQLMARINEILEKDIWFPNLNSCSKCDFKKSCSKLSYN